MFKVKLLLFYQDNNTFPQFQETDYLITCLDSNLLCGLADLHIPDLNLLTSDITTSLLHLQK